MPQLPPCSLDDTSRFLSLLAGDGLLTFQTFDDTLQKRPYLAKIIHGNLNTCYAKLKQLNAQGAGIFVMVNQGDGRGRMAKSVKSVRALFVDLDGAPLEPVMQAPIAPHIVVESSPRRWHAYWLVDGVPLAEFRRIQACLAQRFKADPVVKDLPRVMRLPGFYHQKGNPYLCRVVRTDQKERIAYDDFLKAFDIEPMIKTGTRNDTLFSCSIGFSHHGIPKPSAMRRMKKINQQCDEPLPHNELEQIVNSAYDYPVDGFSKLPHHWVDSKVFSDLSPLACKILMYALRRSRLVEEFSLCHDDFAHIKGMKNRKAVRAAIDELLQAGFLVKTRDYVASKISGQRQPAFYRIGEGVQFVP